MVYIVILVLLILTNALFAASEIAVISLNDAKIENMAEDGNKKAKTILKLVKNPSNFLATIQIGNLILTEATLSFLGVGVPITEPSLGLLVKTGFDVLFSGLWWASVFPGLYIMLIVFGINLLGDFLRDELNPNLK